MAVRSLPRNTSMSRCNRIAAEGGIAARICWADCRTPIRRRSAREVDRMPVSGDCEGVVHPTKETCEGLRGGPFQNAESWVRNQTAEEAALVQREETGAASSQSPSM